MHHIIQSKTSKVSHPNGSQILVGSRSMRLAYLRNASLKLRAQSSPSWVTEALIRLEVRSGGNGEEKAAHCERNGLRCEETTPGGKRVETKGRE